MKPDNSVKQTSDNQTSPELVTGKCPWKGNSKPTFFMFFWTKISISHCCKDALSIKYTSYLDIFPVPTSDKLRATLNASASVPIL